MVKLCSGQLDITYISCWPQETLLLQKKKKVQYLYILLLCNSCKTLIGVHEMLAHDPLLLLTYPRIPHAPHVAGNLPICVCAHMNNVCV